MPTLAELLERLALYEDAEKTILNGNQSYRIGNQEYNKARLGELQREIRMIRQQIAMLRQNGRLSHAITIFGGRR